MITENIGTIKSFTVGSSRFEFTLKLSYGNVHSALHIVSVKQIVTFSDEEVKEIGLDENETVITWNFKVPVNIYPTEFCAINFCGKKLIKSWVTIS